MTTRTTLSLLLALCGGCGGTLESPAELVGGYWVTDNPYGRGLPTFTVDVLEDAHSLRWHLLHPDGHSMNCWTGAVSMSEDGGQLLLEGNWTGSCTQERADAVQVFTLDIVSFRSGEDPAIRLDDVTDFPENNFWVVQATADEVKTFNWQYAAEIQ